MAAKKEESSEGHLFPEVDHVLALLDGEKQHHLVIVVIPSHDRKNNKLDSHKITEWASNALTLVADIYGGGTAFRASRGIYKTSAGEYLYDRPRLIESYASTEAIEDPVRLTELVHFAKRMGKELNQAAIMLVIGQAVIFIEDYSGV
jgi:hypothetical protein